MLKSDSVGVTEFVAFRAHVLDLLMFVILFMIYVVGLGVQDCGMSEFSTMRLLPTQARWQIRASVVKTEFVVLHLPRLSKILLFLLTLLWVALRRVAISPNKHGSQNSESVPTGHVSKYYTVSADGTATVRY